MRLKWRSAEKEPYIYMFFRCSEGTLVVVRRAHNDAQCIFSLQRGVISLQQVASVFWVSWDSHCRE